MPGAALGRGWTDDELAARLSTARVPFQTPPDLAGAGRRHPRRPTASSPGSTAAASSVRARSATGPCWRTPGSRENLERLNDVKGREQFRPVAPMVLEDHAAEIFDDGPIPSPYMLFVHRVRAGVGAPDPGRSARRRHRAHPDGARAVAAAPRRHAGGLPGADGSARGDQHEPEHRRSADGRRPAGRVGALRLRAGRRAGPGSAPGAPRRALRRLPGADRDGPARAFDPPRVRRRRSDHRARIAVLACCPPWRRSTRAPSTRGPALVVVVDDRRAERAAPPAAADRRGLPFPVRVLRSAGRGPPPRATSDGGRWPPRGWCSSTTTSSSDADWSRLLAADLAAAEPAVGAVQARIVVPLPDSRRPTDWERNTAGLQSASFITADMAYRRAALAAVIGLRRAISPGLPRGRRPRAAGARARLDAPAAADAPRCTRSDPPDDWVSLRQQVGRRGRRPDAAPARARLAPPRRHRAGPLPLARGHGRGRRGDRRARGAPVGAVRRSPRRVGWLVLTVDFLRRRISPGPAAATPERRRRAATDGADLPAHPVRRACGTGSAASSRHRSDAHRGRRRCAPCCSTGTAPSCTTSPTTATRIWSRPSTVPATSSSGCAGAVSPSRWSVTSPASAADC